MVRSGLLLYGFWRSSATWRVRIGLAHKGLEYDYRPIDLLTDGGEQNQDLYGTVNPLRQVPVLEFAFGGRTVRLTQSLAILEYLDERYAEPPLLPKDLLLRTQARRIAEIVNAGIQPLQNTGVQRFVREELKGDEKAWTKYWVARGLFALEAAVAESAGRFAVGDNVTIADACIVPQLYFARRFSIDLGPYPTLTRIDAACAELPAFQRAHATAQPDAPR
jgi:maleylpyruvate isomerase